MTKALMPGLVYVCGVFLGMEKLTRSTSANMVVIAVGVAIAAYGEIDFVAVGVAQQLSALVFEALRLMLVQVRVDTWRRPTITRYILFLDHTIFHVTVSGAPTDQ